MGQKGSISILLVLLAAFIFLGSGIYFLRNQHQTDQPTSKPISTPLSQDPFPTATPAPTTAVSANKISLSQLKSIFPRSSLQYFLEIVIGTEYGTNERRIIKWEKDIVKIKKHGNADSSSNACLSKVISDFNQLSTTTKLTLAQTGQDIDLHFAPESEFKGIEPNYVPVNHGFFWVWWTDSGELYKARILINSTEQITSQERCHLVREELTQSMGLQNDSTKYPDSIFYLDWTSTTQYSDIDRDVIKILYGSEIKAGQTYEHIKQYVQ